MTCGSADCASAGVVREPRSRLRCVEPSVCIPTDQPICKTTTVSVVGTIRMRSDPGCAEQRFRHWRPRHTPVRVRLARPLPRLGIPRRDERTPPMFSGPRSRILLVCLCALFVACDKNANPIAPSLSPASGLTLPASAPATHSQPAPDASTPPQGTTQPSYARGAPRSAAWSTVSIRHSNRWPASPRAG